MKLEVLDGAELERADIDSFWAQGVNMDDWDYMVLAPVGILADPINADDPDGESYGQWDVNNYNAERLLTGCCDNCWYKATFRGVEYAVGVAYHA